MAEEMKATLESLVKEKEALESIIRDLDQKMAAYEELGSPEQITEVFDRVDGMVERLESLGSIDEIEESLDLAIEKIKAFESIETPADPELDKYKSLGTPEEIESALDKAEAYITKLESEKISGEFGVSVDTIQEMVGTYESFSKVREVLENLLTSRAPKKDENAVNPVVESVTKPQVSSRFKSLISGL